jgi:hypothetical protein
MIMIHLRQHIHRVTIKRQIRIVYHTQGIKLMAQCPFTEHKLSSVRPIEAINTIDTADAVL